MNRALLNLLTILSFAPLFVLASGCAEEEPTSSSSSTAQPVSAPTGTSFETTRSVQFELSRNELAGLGNLIFVKVSLDSNLVDHVYLGRVDPRYDFEVTLSVPRTADTLYYEVYDEAGGGAADVLATMAKVAASDAATRITDTGMRVLAGAGFSREVPMQRWLRDVRLWTFSPASDEMCRNYLGERLLRLPRSY